MAALTPYPNPLGSWGFGEGCPLAICTWGAWHCAPIGTPLDIVEADSYITRTLESDTPISQVIEADTPSTFVLAADVEG